MVHSYQAITEAAVDAIEAMARDPRDTEICDAGSLLSLAATTYWSWASIVGVAAQDVDCDRMIWAIAELQRKRRLHALSLMRPDQ